MKSKLILIPVILIIVGALSGWLIGLNHIKPKSREILIKARQYAYEPARFEVNKGDTLHIKLVSMDVTHGFFVEGYDLDAEIQANLKTFKVRHPSQGYNWRDADEMLFVADRIGKFRYRCSHTCGTMHPFMQGEMIVKPNSPFHAGVGAIIGFLAGMIMMIYIKAKDKNKLEGK